MTWAAVAWEAWAAWEEWAAVWVAWEEWAGSSPTVPSLGNVG